MQDISDKKVGVLDTERLAKVRQEIDAVDKELLRMLNTRAKLSLEVGSIKAAAKNDDGSGDGIFKPERERQVLKNLEKHNEGPLPHTHVCTIWREIFSSSRALQRPQQVAYLGPEGTFSYFAGLEYLGKSVQMQPFSHFHEVFRAVYDGTCALGVVPLENSLEGTVGQCFDLFYNFDVSIEAELFLHISHNLLSTTQNLREVTKIYSHPQALAQCDTWLRTHAPWAELVPMQSTAAAARQAAGEPKTAAIGNSALVDMYPFNILACSIESSADNWTRFVVISAQNAAKTLKIAKTTDSLVPKKTSILFTLIDKPGSLSSVLSIFAKYGINMRKLESRPLRLSGGECWRYVFFADVECDLQGADFAHAVEKIREMCNSLRILGSYPAALSYAQSAPSASGEKTC